MASLFPIPAGSHRRRERYAAQGSGRQEGRTFDTLRVAKVPSFLPISRVPLIAAEQVSIV